jgi:hypothetical protein
LKVTKTVRIVRINPALERLMVPISVEISLRTIIEALLKLKCIKALMNDKDSIALAI